MTSALVQNNAVVAFYAGDVPNQIQLSNGDTVAGASGALIGATLADGSQVLPATFIDSGPPQSWSYSTGQTYMISNSAVQVTRTWTTPSAAPVSLTFLQFIALFTQAEQAAIVASTDAQVKLFLLMAAGASEIILSDPKTEAGVNYLASQGLIAPQRAAQILANSTTTS